MRRSWWSNLPRSANKIARCIAGFMKTFLRFPHWRGLYLSFVVYFVAGLFGKIWWFTLKHDWQIEGFTWQIDVYHLFCLHFLSTDCKEWEKLPKGGIEGISFRSFAIVLWSVHRETQRIPGCCLTFPATDCLRHSETDAAVLGCYQETKRNWNH